MGTHKFAASLSIVWDLGIGPGDHINLQPASEVAAVFGEQNP